MKHLKLSDLRDGRDGMSKKEMIARIEQLEKAVEELTQKLNALDDKFNPRVMGGK